MRSIHLAAIAALCLMTSIALPIAAQAAPLDITYKQAAGVGVPAAGAGLGAAAAQYGWLGGSAGHTLLAAGATGGAALGGVAGVGVVAGYDAVTQPCAGFQALLGMNKGRCWNGVYR